MVSTTSELGVIRRQPTCPPPFESQKWEICVLQDHYQVCRQERLVIAQAVWLFDVSQQTWTGFNITLQIESAEHFLLVGWILGTGRWPPRLFSLWLRHWRCLFQRVSQMNGSVLCLQSSLTFPRKSIFYPDLLIVIRDGLYSLTSRGRWKAMILKHVLQPSWFILLEIFLRKRETVVPLGIPGGRRMDALCDLTRLEHQLFATL